MYNNNAGVDIECPNCHNKFAITAGKLVEGETFKCPTCEMKFDATQAKKDLQELEAKIKNFGKDISKTFKINLKL